MAKAKDIKAFLVENGIDTQKIRVSTKSSINVKLLDSKLDYDKISRLLSEKYESYQRDDATGEILSGGNTFVFVEYDYDLIKEVSESLQGTIRPFLEKCSGNWEIPSLVNHYLETMPLDHDPHIVRRAIRECFHSFLRENETDLKDLKIIGWN